MYLRNEIEEKSTFAIYDLSEQEEIDSVTLGMLNNNVLDGVLPAHLLQINGRRSFRYNVSDLVTLEEILPDGISAMQAFDILRDIVEAVINAKEYMIEEHSFLFDLQTVFVDTQRKGYLICIPVKAYLGQTLQAFCTSFVQNSNISDLFRRTPYFLEVKNCLEGPEFEVEAFAKILQQIKLKNLIYGEEENVVLKRAERISVQVGQAEAGNLLSHESKWDSKVEGECDKTVFMPLQRGKEVRNPIIVNGNDVVRQEEKTLDKTVFMPVAEQAAVQYIPKATQPIILHNKECIIPDVGDGTVVLTGANAGEQFNGEDATEGLWNRVCARGYLVRTSTGEKIEITKPEFRIGKSRKGTDYCVEGNPAVSRHHAKILQRGDLFWLIDTDSKNRTYVDQKEIESNREINLSHETKIRFADEDYIFLIEKVFN